MRRVRPRNVELDKSLPLVHTIYDKSVDGDAAEELSHQVQLDNGRTVHIDPQSHGKQITIPIPPIVTIAKYPAGYHFGVFRQPASYIKSHMLTFAGLTNMRDRYDLLHDDIEWLKKFNAENKRQQPLTEDEMEALIDFFEREAGKITTRNEQLNLEEKIDVVNVFPKLRAVELASTRLSLKGKCVESVYEYWLLKRKKLGKALLRYFQEPPSRTITSPHIAFRPRNEGRRISKRNPRKDDPQHYIKMHALKRDLLRVMEILQAVQARELVKREMILNHTAAFDVQLAQTPLFAKLAQQIQQISATPQTQTNASELADAKLWFSALRSSLPLPAVNQREEVSQVLGVGLGMAGKAAMRKGAKKHGASAATGAQPSSAERSGGVSESSTATIRIRPKVHDGGLRDGVLERRSQNKRDSGGRRGVDANEAARRAFEEKIESQLAEYDDDFLSDSEDDTKWLTQLEAYGKRRAEEKKRDDAENDRQKAQANFIMKTFAATPQLPGHSALSPPVSPTPSPSSTALAFALSPSPSPSSPISPSRSPSLSPRSLVYGYPVTASPSTTAHSSLATSQHGHGQPNGSASGHAASFNGGVLGVSKSDASFDPLGFARARIGRGGRLLIDRSSLNGSVPDGAGVLNNGVYHHSTAAHRGGDGGCGSSFLWPTQHYDWIDEEVENSHLLNYRPPILQSGCGFASTAAFKFAADTDHTHHHQHHALSGRVAHIQVLFFFFFFLFFSIVSVLVVSGDIHFFCVNAAF